MWWVFKYPVGFIRNVFTSIHHWMFPVKEPEIQLTPIEFEPNVMKPLNKQRIPNHFTSQFRFRRWDGRNEIFEE